MSLVKVGGEWKDIVAGSAVKVSGAWEDISEGFVKVSGSWRKFFDKVLVNVLGGNVVASATSPADSTGGYRLTSAGEEEGFDNTTWNTIGTWIVEGSAGDYEASMSMDSGDDFITASLDTWLPLSTTRTWQLVQSGVGSSSGTGTITIRRASDESVLDSATVTITSTVDP